MYKEIDLEKIRLEYALQEDQALDFKHAKNYEQMQTLLSAVGVNFDIRHNKLHLSINPETYIHTRSRKAGRKVKYDHNDELYCYSDIITMMQYMTDKEIMKQLNMTHATYYRHKKRMLNSTYYNELDKQRLNDINYLKSLRSDFFF